MTSLGKNICANKAGERVKEPGKEPPVSAMAKMFDKSIFSPNSLKSPGLTWRMKSLLGLWVPEASARLRSLLTMGKVSIRG